VRRSEVEGGGAGPATPRRPSWSRAAGGPTALLAIVVVWNFAVAQPVLDVLGRNSPFFAAHGSEPVDVVLLALGLTLVAPAALALVVWLSGLVWRPLAPVLHGLVLGVLAGLFAWQVVERVGVPPMAVRWLLMVAAGAGAVVAYRRWSPARSFVRWLSPAPVVFLVVFLFLTPVSEVVRPATAAPVGAASVRNPVPVVVVVFDELPVVSLMDGTGGIDARSSPNFARLASMSTWYRNTTSVHDHTVGAVPAILDGRNPEGMVLPTLAQHPRNLFTLLGGAYDVDAYEALTMMCPPGVCGGAGGGTPLTTRMRSLVRDTRAVAGRVVMPPELARRFPSLDLRWGDFGSQGGGQGFRDFVAAFAKALQEQPKGAAERKALATGDPVGAVAAFSAGLRPRARPSLHFLHLEMPHGPWRFLPDGVRYDPQGVLPAGEDLTWRSQPSADMNRSRHLLQVGFADRLLGRMLDRMQETGLLDRALVVVTADHGAAFRAGQPMRTATKENIGDVAWVPLFVKRPGAHTGTVDERPAETIDVLPTITDVVGTPADGLDGVSLLARPVAGRRRSIEATNTRVVGRLSLPDGAGPRDRALRSKLSVVGDDPEDPHRLYRAGAYGELVGTEAPRSAAASGLSIESGEVDRFDHLDPRSGTLPVLLRGKLRAKGSDRAAGTHAVISVNGTIAGAVLLRNPGPTEAAFVVLLDPSTFRSGRNEVAAYAVTGPAGSPRFERIPWRR